MIFFFISSLNIGGAERVFVNLINTLSRSKPITLIIESRENTMQHLLDSSVNVIILNNSSYFTNIVSIYKLCLSEKPCCIISTLGVTLKASIAGLFLPNVKVVNRSANTISSYLMEVKRKNKIRYLMQYLNIYFSVLLSDRYVCQSIAMKEDLERFMFFPSWIKERISVINNATFARAIEISKDKDVKCKFLTVATFKPQKNIGRMIDIFNKLNQLTKNWHLTILGEGEEYSNIFSKVENLGLSDKISLKGYVDFPEKYYIDSNYYISTSNYEGVSNSILEALSFGIPIIQLSSKNMDYSVLSNNRGVIFDSESSDGKIANDIYQLIINGELNSIKNRTLRLEYIKKFHSLEKSANLFYDLCTKKKHE